MQKVRFKVKGKRSVELIASDNENLLEAARRAGVMIDSPCSGNATCGKCKVKIVAGKVKTTKSRHISDEEAAAGIVLSCNSTIIEDIEVEVPDLASSFVNEMQITDLSKNENKNISYVRKKMIKRGMTNASRLRSEVIQLPEPNIEDSLADEDRLKLYFRHELGYQDISMSLNLIRKLPDAFRFNNFKIEVVYLKRREVAEILDVKPANAEKTVLYGMALDIGTTSVSACLVDMNTNEIVTKISMGNAQVKYGADVINRMVYSEKPGGLENLRHAIVDETINNLIEKMVSALGIFPEDIYEVCAAGNTTMNHLLLGINPNYLRREPFIPAINDIPEMKCSEVGIKINPEGKIYLAPSVASYVGGDITAGVFAVPVWMREEFTMLVDLGTNGEIVFGNKDFLMTCACSAGPAFEGGEISCGTRAVPGAIEAVIINEGDLRPFYNTIGCVSPIGICGSGIIDLICEMKRTGIINGKGRMDRDLNNPRIRFDEYGIGQYFLYCKELDNGSRDVYITEIDIDSFIKAKGAVFSAIYTLMESLDMSIDVLENVYVAGGIGTNLVIENAIALGMLPDIPVEKYYYIGNSSMQGCYLALTLTEGKDQIREISKNMTYMELSIHPTYMDEFIAACFIPHTNMDLFPSLKN
ncbi:corrinoid activation/regeneration protein AcsV [Acetobacterium bakii]|uniref:Ferredoxin n=1 Tax=Acetobacterium bakii TaxID=52689 RepID=A0A0L6U226_9FIRM|nr:corrinoid activation/regeneration protein AcsV [Acetobacterium bakii]KNZ42377.1 ferredoxin [Acetobacterium bakii]